LKGERRLKIETKTSVYELTLDQNTKELVLTKKQIKQGKSSRVEPGREFRGTRVEINPFGLTLYKFHEPVISTSALINL